MLKKIMTIVFATGFILCMLTGCEESASLDELVQNEQSIGIESDALKSLEFL